MGGNTRLNKLVWDELNQAKSWEQYISEYTGREMDWRNYYNIASIVLSITGSTTWTLWKVLDIDWMNYVTPVLFVLTATSQIISAIQTKVVVDESTLKSLSKLRSMYIEYFNKLEKLYLCVHGNTMNQDDVKKEFFALRETVYPIEELKDSLNIRELKNVSKKVKIHMEKYLKDRWYS